MSELYHPQDNAEANYPTVDDVIGRKDDGFARRALRGYFFSRNPERSVRLHTAMGAAVTRKAIMGTFGRLFPPKPLSNYRLDPTKSRIEAATRFATGGSVVNEVIHSVAAMQNIFYIQAELQDGGNPTIGLVALGVNSLLVSLQRYNRARLMMRIDEELQKGEGYDEEYKNWMGVDGTGLRAE